MNALSANPKAQLKHGIQLIQIPILLGLLSPSVDFITSTSAFMACDEGFTTSRIFRW